MNKRLETLLERVATWSEEAQAEFARVIVEIERQQSDVYRLSDDERAAIEEGLAQADRGEFVSEEDMAAFFKRHGV